MTKEESIFLDSGLLELYALSSCSPKEAMEVERMLASSNIVRQEYDQIQIGIEVLAKSRSTSPPPGTRENILSQLSEEIDQTIPKNDNTVNTKETSKFWKVLTGLALLISLCLLFFQINKNRSLEKEIEQLNKTMAQHSTEANTMNLALNDLQKEYDFLVNENTKKVVLSENQKYQDLQLVAYWNENEQKTLLDIKSMPKPPAGKCFQLWADVNGEMISVAVISNDKKQLQLGSFHVGAESLNITLEDAPGSKHATVTALVSSARV